MKEIHAYQSDDGKFIGTKEAVLKYENDIVVQDLLDDFMEDTDEDGDHWFGVAVRYSNDPYVFVEYLKDNPKFREFIKLVYAMGEQDDLTEKDLFDYISYLGERLQWKLGLLQVWNVRSNPLEWMEWLLSAKRHDNFFETRVTDYTHAGLQGTVSYDRYK